MLLIFVTRKFTESVHAYGVLKRILEKKMLRLVAGSQYVVHDWILFVNDFYGLDYKYVAVNVRLESILET